jgi:hypothetical protein
MKEEYDFSKGERGKFFRNNVKLNLPVYLDDEVMAFVERVAKKKNQDISSVVNQLLRNGMQIADMVQ